MEKLVNIKTDLADLKDLLIVNVEKITVRGERLEELQKKTEDLLAQSQAFQKASENLKWSMWWTKNKFKLIFGTAGAGVTITTILLL